MTRARRRAVANVLACGVVVGGFAFVAALSSWTGVVALALTVLVTAALTWRAATLRADRTDDGLVVRNLWRTCRVPDSEVLAYERRWSVLASARGYRAYCPVAVTRQGRVTLLALAGDESSAERSTPPGSVPG